MAATSKKLGKGLSVLISEEYSKSVEEGGEQSALRQLGVTEIVSGKYQPRTRFTQEYLEELAESIKANGIMQPIIVRPSAEVKDKFEIIAGERRWRAARLAELETVPVIVQDISDQKALELALIENIQRQDLSPLDEASGYQRLLDEFSYTQEELATTVGKSRSHIANLLRLLSLPEKIRALLEEEKISMGHARALLNAKNPEKLAEEVVRRGLNVRQTENLARGETSGNSSRSSSRKPASGDYAEKEKDPDIIALEETLSESLGLRVSIQDRGKSGQIVLFYDSLSQLDEILKRLGGGA